MMHLELSRYRKFLGWFACAVLGCGGSPSEQGVETSPCIDGLCFGDLECRSDVCVAGEADGVADGGLDGDDEGTGGDGGDGGDPSAGDPSGGAEPTSGEDTVGDSDGPQCGVGGLPQGSTCDPALDECEACSRCGGYLDVDRWTSELQYVYRCEPRPADPGQIGDSCLTPLSATSYETCIDGARCFSLDLQEPGRCLPSCSAGRCGAGQDCLNDNWCLDRCDLGGERWETPTSEVCGPGWGCYPLGDGGAHCLPYGGAGISQTGDACALQTDCSPGFVCERGGAYLRWVQCKPLCPLDEPTSCVGGASVDGLVYRCIEPYDLVLPAGVGVCGYVEMTTECYEEYDYCLDQGIDVEICEATLLACLGR